MAEPTLSVATYIRTDAGGDVPVADAESVAGKREYLLGTIEFDVRYRASFRVRVTDDIDYLWPFLGAAVTQFLATGAAGQPTSFGDSVHIARDKQRGRATLTIASADGPAQHVSLPERVLLSELAREAQHVAEHLLRLTGSDRGLSKEAANFWPG